MLSEAQKKGDALVIKGTRIAERNNQKFVKNGQNWLKQHIPVNAHLHTLTSPGFLSTFLACLFGTIW